MIRKISLVIVILLVLWSVWIYTGRSMEFQDPQLNLMHQEWVMNDSLCNKNVVGIQPFMITTDYLNEKQFYEKLKGYFDQAKREGYFKQHTVVLLPEYLGTWLVVSNEKKSVLETKHINSAMTLMILSNPVRFIRALFHHQNEPDPFASAIFRMKAKEMARQYSRVFKSLAQTYNVTINPGSIILPGPFIGESKQLEVNLDEPLYNVSFIFHPDGTIDNQIIRKSYPIESEKPFVTAYPINKLPVFDLPIGKTSIVVCADSWYPESYEQIQKQLPDVILVNSYCAGEETMQNPWKGYDGGELPVDVDEEDIGNLTEREAWIKYALPGRIKSVPVPYGVNVFLRGELWDLGTDGDPFFIQLGELQKTGVSERAGIWSMCLN